jgi:hypothetical protein
MKLLHHAGRSAFAIVLAVFAGKAGAMAPPSEMPAPSVADRVAAIRARAAQLSTAGSHAAVPLAARPAQVAWNDWKNE